MHGRSATNFKGSRSSLTERAFANPTLHTYHLVFHLVCLNSALLWCKCKADSGDCCCSAPECDCCWFSCGKVAFLQAKRGIQSTSSALESPFWQLGEGTYFLVHSNVFLHREYQAQLFPWTSRATAFQRTHLAMKIWSFLFCSEWSSKEISSFIQLFFSLYCSFAGLIFSRCGLTMYFTHLKEHFCFLPTLSAPSKPLPGNRSTGSQTTWWFGSVCQ